VLVGGGLFVAVLLLYWLTFSPTPTSDAGTWVITVDQPDWDYMLLAAHPLPVYVVWLVKQALAGLGVPVAPLTIFQALAALLAATGAVLFYGALLLLAGDVVIAAAGGALLAASFGYWYFANGEVHHFGLVFVLAAFLLAVRRRVAGAPGPDYGAAIALGVLSAVAIVFHQDAVLFGFALVAMLVVGRPWRPAIREAAAYVVAGSVATAVLAVAIGVFIRGVGSVRGFFQWYFWPTWAMGTQVYDVGGVSGSVLRSVKAQLTALIYGTQVVYDVTRDRTLLREPLALGLLALSVIAYAVMVALLWRLWRARRALPAAVIAAVAGCLVWLAVYKLFLNSWFQPASTEYHVATLPPLLLLILLGLRGWPAGPATPRARGIALGLVAIFLGVNFYGAILPWWRYGEAKEALGARFGRELAAGDLFVSSESGIDPVFARGRHLGVKDLFKEKPKTEGFALIETTVAERLQGGGRVFLYNFTPNPFTLRRINLEAGRRGNPAMSIDDFERFLARLRERYAFVPVLGYWEESKIPLFMYGRRSETIWEVRANNTRGRAMPGPAKTNGVTGAAASRPAWAASVTASPRRPEAEWPAWPDWPESPGLPERPA
jgi:hypothetical protein